MKTCLMNVNSELCLYCLRIDYGGLCGTFVGMAMC